ncbi:MAG TPA: P63C domain-containing protein [Herpetosiphonaceae bacterium]|nr:P63C domain-containing protein [Herpetosiphonaceae bacterium]
MTLEEDGPASEAGKALAKLGARKGGKARASVLTPTERSEIARKAGSARWAKAGKVPRPSPPNRPTVIAGGEQPDPLPYSLLRGTIDIGAVAFECHVLNDHRRVLTQGEVVRVLTGGRDSSDLARYLRSLPSYTDHTLDGRTIQFKVPGNPQVATGYEATLLVEICEMYLNARDMGKEGLKPNQRHLAKNAEVVIRACAKVGIIALVDEATGFQEIRRKRALQLKLQAFIAEDMQEWAKTFPDDFWFELARLENTRYSPRHRPLRWGKYVMAFVYDAIDKDVGKELRKINPNPQHRSNHHQWLQQFGKEKVHDQLQAVIAVMKACDDMDEFRRKFAKVFKRGSGEQMEFDFTFDYD